MSDPADPLVPTLSTPPADGRDHFRGPPTAVVTLVEYGDYECPYCRKAHPIVRDVREHFGPRLRVAFRNFPLSQMHPHAQLAAEAAEAAGAQGEPMFWAMHDQLFEHQPALARDDLLRYAGRIGLDADRFARELADGTHTARVRADFIGGLRSGVNGTPTFFVNNRRHDEPWDAETLVRAIERAAANAVAPAGPAVATGGSAE